MSQSPIVAHCERCDHQVEGEYRAPTRRKWAKIYFLLPLPFVPVFPIMAADYAVCLPLLMVYLLGVGPVLAILKDPPHCTECGAILRPSSGPTPAGETT